MTARPHLPALRDVIKTYGLGAKKSLGQHFLLDTNLTDRIARAAGDLNGKHVVEIGPGPGGLTRSILAQAPASLSVIERDQRCIDALIELRSVYPDILVLHEADAMKVTLSEMAPRPTIIISNLPYNVGTALLIKWLNDLDGIERMVLMFQKEVAERVAAPPGSDAYGRLAILTQWLCEAHILFNVDKRAFTPPPKVMSAVIEVIPRKTPLAEAELPKLERVTQAAFGQRRKMLRSSLKSLGINPADAGIDPQRRAEQLTVEEFCALARMI
ncbi:MAG: 16S rRNA (adenine(1518)-N(6)/adenine(1519)-N(6))-dimethyltransferase RsmA [Rhodospirillales bacterium]|nr:16S rRNA (adenine(1518)-N(6)/adenine(1519)-N(6))-dimethyltransferase RsmA [Rhodospirillales bacterium]MBO6786249.1 16S rRNA (adenine(1518)-N(6)/adenine(1519)-N(6))-dimethyltransferase RsmA [Rhodospirillales bacterium]